MNRNESMNDESKNADDVRALIEEARQWPRDGVNEGPLINALADALEVRPHGTVTDAEVEAGAWALLDRGMDLADRSPSQQVFDEAKAEARAVLEAAREAAL